MGLIGTVPRFLAAQRACLRATEDLWSSRPSFRWTCLPPHLWANMQLDGHGFGWLRVSNCLSSLSVGLLIDSTVRRCLNPETLSQASSGLELQVIGSIERSAILLIFEAEELRTMDDENKTLVLGLKHVDLSLRGDLHLPGDLQSFHVPRVPGTRRCG